MQKSELNMSVDLNKDGISLEESEESSNAADDKEILFSNEDSDWELLSTSTFDTEDISEDSKNEGGKIKDRVSLYEETVSGKKKRYRKRYPEIVPGYASDSSTEETFNTIGNISLEKYENFPHIVLPVDLYIFKINLS